MSKLEGAKQAKGNLWQGQGEVMEVIINRLTGQHFENLTQCDVCGGYATVVSFCGQGFDELRVCSLCLQKAQDAISKAIMERVREWGS